MNNPTMLYRCPGPESFEGVSCETTIVEDTDVDAAKADGWHSDWMQAKAAKDQADAAAAADAAADAAATAGKKAKA